MQNQRGFIQIPLLIIVIASIAIASVGAGVVLHKQGEFHLFVNRISREFTDTFHRPLADKAIPIISDINVSKITTDSARISWRTDEPTKTKFFLGIDTNWNIWQESFERLSTDHWISKLPSLNPSTAYYFKIEAVDKAGNKTTSQDQTFTTLKLEIATSSQQSVLPQEPVSPSPESCQNECDQSGLKQCIKGILSVGSLVSENYGYQTCGDFDTDSCLEWGEPIDCPSSSVCENGICQEIQEELREQHNNCQGTSDSCGLTFCVNCNKSDGWINMGGSYSCCDGNKTCVCQKQEHRDYTCSGTSCNYSITSTRIDKNNCTGCSSFESCLNGICQSNCVGTDISCGSENCMNCNNSDGWVNSISIPFPYCDGNKTCTDQKQEYRNYFCLGSSCSYSITDARTNKSCIECGSSKYCSGGTCLDKPAKQCEWIWQGTISGSSVSSFSPIINCTTQTEGSTGYILGVVPDAYDGKKYLSTSIESSPGSTVHRYLCNCE